MIEIKGEMVEIKEMTRLLAGGKVESAETLRRPPTIQSSPQSPPSVPSSPEPSSPYPPITITGQTWRLLRQTSSAELLVSSLKSRLSTVNFQNEI